MLEAEGFKPEEPIDLPEETLSCTGEDLTSKEMSEGLTISLPMDGFNPDSLDRLQKLVDSKARLIRFTDGLADGSLSCITKYVFSYNEKYEMQGAGEDPAYASEKSKSDKDISGLLSTINETAIKMYFFISLADVMIEDGRGRMVVDLDFMAREGAHVVFHGEIKHLITLTPEPEPEPEPTPDPDPEPTPDPDPEPTPDPDPGTEGATSSEESPAGDNSTCAADSVPVAACRRCSHCHDPAGPGRNDRDQSRENGGDVACSRFGPG